MGGETSMHGEDEKLESFSSPKPEGKDHMGDIYIDGRIILKCALRNRG
jgi:hypothetical protein